MSKGFGKALPLMLAAGAAAAISKYRLHEEPMLAYQRLKNRLLSVPPPKTAAPPLDWEAIRASADATMRIRSENGSQYLETWVRGAGGAKRTPLSGDGRRGTTGPTRGNRIPQDIIDVFQTPGRQQVHMDISEDDTLWMIKDDSNLPQDQVFITFDVLAPRVSWAKRLEAWTSYRGSLSVTLQAEMISLPFGTGAICIPPSDATDYVNNCSNTQAALITMAQMDTIRFRKPVGLFADWVQVGVYDNSIWSALGGKIVRIIWERD
jgi:hypothetical protein